MIYRAVAICLLALSVIPHTAEAQAIRPLQIGPISPNQRLYVAILGAVNRPGTYEFDSATITLGDLLERAGGNTSPSNGNVSIIRNARAGEKTFHSNRSYQLIHNDVVVLEPNDASAGFNDSAETASDRTPVALVGIAPRPIVLGLHTDHATLVQLVASLNQPPRTTNTTRVFAPNGSLHTNPTLKLQPGSTIVFDPAAVILDAVPPSLSEHEVLFPFKAPTDQPQSETVSEESAATHPVEQFDSERSTLPADTETVVEPSEAAPTGPHLPPAVSTDENAAVQTVFVEAPQEDADHPVDERPVIPKTADAQPTKTAEKTNPPRTYGLRAPMEPGAPLADVELPDDQQADSNSMATAIWAIALPIIATISFLRWYQLNRRRKQRQQLLKTVAVDEISHHEEPAPAAEGVKVKSAVVAASAQQNAPAPESTQTPLEVIEPMPRPETEPFEPRTPINDLPDNHRIDGAHATGSRRDDLLQQLIDNALPLTEEPLPPMAISEFYGRPLPLAPMRVDQSHDMPAPKNTTAAPAPKSARPGAEKQTKRKTRPGVRPIMRHDVVAPEAQDAAIIPAPHFDPQALKTPSPKTKSSTSLSAEKIAATASSILDRALSSVEKKEQA